MNEIIDYSLVRLFSDSKDFVLDHISALPPDDIYLRFGYNPSREQIDKYLTHTMGQSNNFRDGNYWWGLTCSDKLVATIHVSIKDDVAEFAFSTDAQYRGKKLGQLLFARGYQLVTEFQISRIYMVCLSKNSAMRHIAKKFGMSVMTQGTDSEASVTISYPVPLSRLNEVTMCIIDKGICK